MVKIIHQSIWIFLLGILPNFGYTFQNPDIPPCNLTFYGWHFSNSRASNFTHFPNFPLAWRQEFPIVFELHNNVPETHRSVFRLAASELNQELKFEAIAIASSINDKDTRENNVDSHNLIYWFNQNQYNMEQITSFNGFGRVGAETFFHLLPPLRYHPYILISEADIVFYEEQNTVMGRARRMFELNLRAIGLSVDPNMNALELQKLFVERLSNMNSDEFYQWIVQFLKSRGVYSTLTTITTDIRGYMLEEINTKRHIEPPLASFESLQNFLVREYAIDLQSLDSSAMIRNHALHEFGHALGLGENNIPSSIMFNGISAMSVIPLLPREFMMEKPIDDFFFEYGLLCSYDLDHLRATYPLF